MTLINGKETNCIPVTDRGLQYGDGVFETIRIKDGNLSLWNPHMERLNTGCRHLDIPFAETGLLFEEAKRVCHQAQQGVLKIIITRGSGGRGYAPPNKINATRILSLYPFPNYPTHFQTQGIQARICQQRLVQNPRLAGIKHLNRLEQVLARKEWDDSSICEGIMLDNEESVIEGTMSNIFVVLKNNTIVTPELSKCGIHGIMRQQIIELLKEGPLAVIQEDLTVQDLLDANEVFITNSVIGVWPVRKIVDKVYKVGTATKDIINQLVDRGIV